MASLRRTTLVLLGLVILATLAWFQPASGQMIIKGKPIGPGGVPIDNPGNPSDPSEFSQAIQLPTDSKLKKKLDAAQDYIKEEKWTEAARILQGLLDITEDKFVQVPKKDVNNKETLIWTSVKSEANRMVGTLPPA